MSLNGCILSNVDYYPKSCFLTATITIYVAIMNKPSEQITIGNVYIGREKKTEVKKNSKKYIKKLL